MQVLKKYINVFLSFENNAHRTSYKWFFPATVEINDYNVMTDEKRAI